MKRVALILILMGLNSLVFSQSDSSFISKNKNIIKWNLTPMALIGPGSIVFGYERILKNNQSFSITAGALKMKPIKNRDGETIQLFGEVKRSGFDIALDYRFYFKKRNKYPAPDGLYWGPYTSLYNLNFSGRSNVFEDGVLVNEVGIDTKFHMYNLGVQLGYQFVIKDAIAIDLYLVGPSYSYYSFEIGFDAATALDPDSEFYQDFHDLLSTIIPGSEVILDGIDFQTGGSTRFSYWGYRYGIQIGYVF